MTRLGLVTTTAAGRNAANRLAGHLPDTSTYPVTELPKAWRECDALVCFLAVGATVRLLAPLLAADDSSKATDPGVVCVDEAQRFVVPVVGGHAGGANALAAEVADLLGATAVITTATDATSLAGLDALGLPVEGDVAAVSRALLDRETVSLTSRVRWPLPPLPVIPANDVSTRASWCRTRSRTPPRTCRPPW